LTSLGGNRANVVEPVNSLKCATTTAASSVQLLSDPTASNPYLVGSAPISDEKTSRNC
jgi:hypothetical protein